MQSQLVQKKHLQITMEILSVCREPKVKTQVMSELDITLKKFQFCVKHLMKQGLLRLHHRKKTYVTTERGLRYLELWTKLDESNDFS